MEKREGFGCSLMEAMGMGSCRCSKWRGGISVIGCGVYIWLSLVGPKFEAVIKIREEVSY